MVAQVAMLSTRVRGTQVKLGSRAGQLPAQLTQQLSSPVPLMQLPCKAYVTNLSGYSHYCLDGFLCVHKGLEQNNNLGKTRDVQREIPIPSLPYGFKLFSPGNFPYGNSREIPEIREFPELREFPVLRRFRKFPSHGKLPFSKCTYIGFSIGFLHQKACFTVFSTVNLIVLV